MDLESEIGGWGRFQTSALFISGFTSFITSSQIFGWVFTGVTPLNRCALPGIDPNFDWNTSNLYGNDISGSWFWAHQHFLHGYNGSLGFGSDKEGANYDLLKEFYAFDTGGTDSPSMCHYYPERINAFLGLDLLTDPRDASFNKDYIIRQPSSLKNTKSVLNNSKSPTESMKDNHEIRYNNGSNFGPKLECGTHIYDDSIFSSSLVSQFDLICADAWQASLVASLNMVGCFLSSLIVGSAADRYGRRRAMLVASFLGIPFYFGMVFVRNYLSLCIIQIVIGLCSFGPNMPAYCIFTEFIGRSHRTVASVWWLAIFSAGGAYSGVVAYFIRDWQTAQLLISAPSLIMVPSMLLLPESVLWLVSQGRAEAAASVVAYVRRFNGRTTDLKHRAVILEALEESIWKYQRASDAPTEVINIVIEPQPATNLSVDNDAVTPGDIKEFSFVGHPQSEASASLITDKHATLSVDQPDMKRCQPGKKNIFWNLRNVTFGVVKSPPVSPRARRSPFVELFFHPIMCRNTLVIFLAWFACSMNFFGISMSAALLPGDLFLTFLLSIAMELPGFAVTAALLDRIGRRATLSSLYGIGGLCMIISAAIPRGYLSWLVILLMAIGKMGAAGGFAIVFQYSAEIFPTPARSSAIGAASAVARVASILSPQIALLGTVLTAPWAPFVVYGSVALLSGVTVIAFLPETRGKLLPQTIEESIALSQREYSNILRNSMSTAEFKEVVGEEKYEKNEDDY